MEAMDISYDETQRIGEAAMIVDEKMDVSLNRDNWHENGIKQNDTTIVTQSDGNIVQLSTLETSESPNLAVLNKSFPNGPECFKSGTDSPSRFPLQSTNESNQSNIVLKCNSAIARLKGNLVNNPVAIGVQKENVFLESSKNELFEFPAQVCQVDTFPLNNPETDLLHSMSKNNSHEEERFTSADEYNFSAADFDCLMHRGCTLATSAVPGCKSSASLSEETHLPRNSILINFDPLLRRETITKLPDKSIIETDETTSPCSSLVEVVQQEQKAQPTVGASLSETIANYTLKQPEFNTVVLTEPSQTSPSKVDDSALLSETPLASSSIQNDEKDNTSYCLLDKTVIAANVGPSKCLTENSTHEQLENRSTTESSEVDVDHLKNRSSTVSSQVDEDHLQNRSTTVTSEVDEDQLNSYTFASNYAAEQDDTVQNRANLTESSPDHIQAIVGKLPEEIEKRDEYCVLGSELINPLETTELKEVTVEELLVSDVANSVPIQESVNIFSIHSATVNNSGSFENAQSTNHGLKCPFEKMLAEPQTDKENSAIFNMSDDQMAQNEDTFVEAGKKNRNEDINIAEMEKKMQDVELREESMLKRITEKDKTISKMSNVVEAYERTIAELISEKEVLIRTHDQECEGLKQDNEINAQHMESLEKTFSNLYAKYERMKKNAIKYKDNEEKLLEKVVKLEECLRAQEQRYEKMKSHAMSQLEIANTKIDEAIRNHSQESAKLKAQIKKEELYRISINEQLIQKSKENEELVKICDELISETN